MTTPTRVRAVGGGLFIPLAWPAVAFLLVLAYSTIARSLSADARTVLVLSGLASLPCAVVAVIAWCSLWWHGVPSKAATLWAAVALLGAMVALRLYLFGS